MTRLNDDWLQKLFSQSDLSRIQTMELTARGSYSSEIFFL